MAGQDRSVWNTAPLDRPWVRESPTVTRPCWAAGPAAGGATVTPSVGSGKRGRTRSVTSTSGGVRGSRYSGGSCDISDLLRRQSNSLGVEPGLRETDAGLRVVRIFARAIELR